MKKHIIIPLFGAIAVIAILIAFTACDRKTTADSHQSTDVSSEEGVPADEFSIYGEWRYVITKEFEDTYVEERLSRPASVLRIFNSNNIVAEFVSGPYTNYGTLKKIDEYIYSFTYMAVSEYGNYEMTDTIRYDPTTRRFGMEDGESGISIRYYERIRDLGSEPPFSPSLMHTQNKWLYGTWINEDKGNTLTFMEPNILIEEGGTAVVGGKNTINFSFDGRTLVIAEGDNESSQARLTFGGDTITIDSFQGGHDWHYNIFLWGTFRKTR
ncbi:MAG: hypothetical protein FWD28_10750 [Treponema sp.]|nr:hypothetical protein [Treponema sp.]